MIQTASKKAIPNIIQYTYRAKYIAIHQRKRTPEILIYSSLLSIKFSRGETS